MEELIFTIYSEELKNDLKILVESIRKFGGEFSYAPIWVITPEQDNYNIKKIKLLLKKKHINIINYQKSASSPFPFMNFVEGAAKAENLSMFKSELFVWLNSNSLVLQEPKKLLIDSEKNIGYRPVHHINIGSQFSDPIDPFWDLVYSKCNVPLNKVYPMKTHVDNRNIRPYFNAGFMILRPEIELFRKWYQKFKEIYQDPELISYYKKNKLYAIFIHQVILSALILSEYDKEELQELPFEYNYPLNLYFKTARDFIPKNMSDIVTARYEELDNLTKIPFNEPFKSWILEKI